MCEGWTCMTVGSRSLAARRESSSRSASVSHPLTSHVPTLQPRPRLERAANDKESTAVNVDLIGRGARKSQTKAERINQAITPIDIEGHWHKVDSVKSLPRLCNSTSMTEAFPRNRRDSCKYLPSFSLGCPPHVKL